MVLINTFWLYVDFEENQVSVQHVNFTIHICYLLPQFTMGFPLSDCLIKLITLFVQHTPQTQLYPRTQTNTK